MDKEIKKLFLESFHIKNDAKLIPFSGYNMPINYKNGIIKEHLATRSDCGIFDVSHMLQINIIANEQTTKKLENIIPLDLYNLKIGKSAYSFILNDNGGIIDDLIISKIINNKDVSMANADQVKEQTGFSIGGVSPIGHIEKINILVDKSLSRFENIYAAAGHPHSIFKITYKQLLNLTDGKEENIV